MKKFKASLAAILTACSLLGLAGCSENREQTPNDGSQSSNSSKSSSSESSQSSNSSKSSSSESLQTSSSSSSSSESVKTEPIKPIDKNIVNSVKLFDAISADKENAMFSPLSLNMALGSIQAGAKGETKAQLDAYLNTENYADFAERYIGRVHGVLTNDGKGWRRKSTVEIANSFWVDNSLPLKDAYKNTVSKKFESEIQNVDFDKKGETLKKINGWVDKKTHNMIPKALENYDDGTIAALLNTVYFESPWDMSEWCVNEEDKTGFTLLDGTVKPVQLMRSYGNYYFENDSAAAFSRKYSNEMEFIGILPKRSGDFTLESLDIPSLLDSRTDIYDVTAKMPRLNFETEFKLNDALMDAGLKNMFVDAELSGITDQPFCVTDVMQKTKLELDENGTKAAAVTAIFGAGGGHEVMGVREVVLDRPFAFLIIDHDFYDSGEDRILFMGKVTNP